MIGAVITAGTVALISLGIAYHRDESRIMSVLSIDPVVTHSGQLVSAIIPALQEEDYLPDLLQSIRNQDYSPIEIIVADSSIGESQAKTKEICAQYGAVYLHVPEHGVGLARNKGASVSTGEYLVFVDADCVLRSDCISQFVRSLEEGYVLVHAGDIDLGDTSLGIQTLLTRVYLKPHLHTTGRGIAIRRSDFNYIVGYPDPEVCDPLWHACREDLAFGRKVADNFGRQSILLTRKALVGTSPRREAMFGWSGYLKKGDGVWDGHAGVRKGKVIDSPH